MAAYLKTLPDERRAEFRQSIRAHFTKMRPLWKSVRAARNNVSDTLKADPFDKAKFESAMEALRQAEFTARKSMTPVLSKLAAKLTPEERRKFLKHHSKRHTWRRRKWRRHQHDAPFDMDKTVDEATPPSPAP